MRQAKSSPETAAFAVLGAISLGHLLNDLLQSLIPAIYPVLKTSFGLSFSQIGIITLVFYVAASVFQPLVGLYADKRTQPYALPTAMVFSMCGILLLALAPNNAAVLTAALLVGLGSSVFHPEASRVARAASGGRHGLAQSVFQVGGTFGSALGPLAAAYLVVPRGQESVAWFGLVAFVAMILLSRVGSWHGKQAARRATHAETGPRRRVGLALSILLLLIFSKYFYLAGIGSFFTFYLIDRFHLTVTDAQLHLFAFSAASAAGTFFGGPLGDRFGRKYVIWASILGVLPFSLALPYADLVWTGVLSVIIGATISAAFSAIVVYGQELMPGRVGAVSGLFFGFAFGMAGMGAAVLGTLADLTSIGFVYKVCAFLPALGLFTAFLPDLGAERRRVLADA
ncbi:MAG TPA: MFS transporter [Stellaceae bacterium]|nr:MFS transporter [Stellaceae bacterium]